MAASRDFSKPYIKLYKTVSLGKRFYKMHPRSFWRWPGGVSLLAAAHNTVRDREKLPESGTVIRKFIICARSRTALSLSLAAQFLHHQKAFLLISAVQNIHGYSKNWALFETQFFEQSKTANLQSDCAPTTSLYLAPKSSALFAAENSAEKSRLSLKIHSANTAQKLPCAYLSNYGLSTCPSAHK